MKKIKSILQQLKTRKTNLLFTDTKWKLFLTDHRSELLQSCTSHMISSFHMRKYRYRLREYIAILNYPKEFIDIVLLLNDLPSEMEFKNLSCILLPNQLKVDELYEKYRTVV